MWNECDICRFGVRTPFSCVFGINSEICDFAGDFVGPRDLLDLDVDKFDDDKFDVETFDVEIEVDTDEFRRFVKP